jgi:hypothetical protein
MKINVSNIIILTLLILIIAILIFFWSKLSNISNHNNKQLDDLKKSIISYDKLVKEGEGKYSKLIDYYSTHTQLLSELKQLDKGLYSNLKSQDEKILNLTKVVLSFNSKLDSGIIIQNPTDTNQLDLVLDYPSKDSSFVNWSGTINKLNSKYYGAWNFKSLPISIVVTEESRGLWKHRLIGPSWLRVDSLSVKSIPPQEYTQTIEKKLQFLFGANYTLDLKNIGNIGIFGAGVGISYNHYHTLLVNINSAQQLGFGYYYTFRSFKNKK